MADLVPVRGELMNSFDQTSGATAWARFERRRSSARTLCFRLYFIAHGILDRLVGTGTGGTVL